ncbi:serine hydrolase domain-containing protein [Actinomadura luteofluorescens]|uniref:serine hydrolase domain-containing protein n=1 Tax=Actinomadura luteofluorescens TaxID=46163 RepID=UPI003483B7D9
MNKTIVSLANFLCNASQMSRDTSAEATVPSGDGRRQIGGRTTPGFTGVRQAFEATLVHRTGAGAALCVIHNGRTAVDLWGGTDLHGRPFTADTLQLVFSATKGAAALCTALLVERDQLDIHRPVAYYWPEFAQAGKQTLTVDHALSHRGGLAALDRRLSLDDVFDGEPVIESLAAQRPLWKPGSAHGYHAVTYRFLVGKLVKRETGTPLSRYFAAEVREPLGLDFWIGLPPDLEPRVAPLIDGPPPGPAQRLILHIARRRRSLLWRSLTLDGTLHSASTAELFNQRRSHAAQMASATGIRALAGMYAAALGQAGGTPLLSPPVLETVTRPRAEGWDRCMFTRSRFALGFGLHSKMSPFTSQAAFGHYGISGSFGFADPTLDLAIGYITSHIAPDATNDPRIRALRAALMKSATTT